ncbi:hypothetical protein LCGC14_2716180 [marine sediment metagenome]|uniref:Uncharacterized protein n=1 Tax=marine sediment metagenome TaxID=412755 RepID=A0A0F8ZBI9_9ZZZZ
MNISKNVLKKQLLVKDILWVNHVKQIKFGHIYIDIFSVNVYYVCCSRNEYDCLISKVFKAVIPEDREKYSGTTEGYDKNGQIIDVIAIDITKKHIYEYEFKQTSHDLIILEKRKVRYSSSYYKQPHKFYYVIPDELWLKEEEYLRSEKCGVIVYSNNNKDHNGRRYFTTMLPCKLRTDRLLDYTMVKNKLLARCTSAYCNLLMEYHGKKKSWY